MRVHLSSDHLLFLCTVHRKKDGLGGGERDVVIFIWDVGVWNPGSSVTKGKE